MSKLTRRIQAALYRRRGFAEVRMDGYPILLSTESNAKQVLWLKRKLSRGDFEPHVIDAILENVRAGQTVFEIGSWVGPYSVLFSKLIGDAGSLYLFEPDPVARRICGENLRLNHCQNSFLFPFAISNRSGANLLYSQGSFGDSVSSLVPDLGMEAKASVDASKSARIITCTLDSFVDMTGQYPDLVKIDVEGAEDLVIAGGRSVVARKGVKVIMEVHSKFLRCRDISPSDVIGSLRSLNKKVWLLDESPRELIGPDDRSFTDLTRFHILACD